MQVVYLTAFCRLKFIGTIMMKRLAIAPHRLYFFLGTLLILVLFFWWWMQLQHPATMQIPLHAMLMPLGVFPLFILGFTFTAGPKWLSVESKDQYFLLHGGTYFFGVLTVILASGIGLGPLRSSGFALMLSAWCAVTWRWARLLIRSNAVDKKHGFALLLGMCGGVLSLIVGLLWSMGWGAGWQYARHLALFGFLLPIFLTVCHRMLPFFSGNVLKPYVVWRPYTLLGGWLLGCYLLVLSGSCGFVGLQALTASMLSLSFLYTSWRWGIIRSLQNRLLAMLHLSFAWLIIVFAIVALDGFGFHMGSAATHALALGFMGTMLVGFVSRVSYGHSGRPLQVSQALWILYLGLHVSAALRIFASILSMPELVLVSATAWLLLMACWIAMMVPMYLKARADGQPG